MANLLAFCDTDHSFQHPIRQPKGAQEPHATSQLISGNSCPTNGEKG